MALTRPQKEAVVASLHDAFQRAGVVIVTRQSGLTVAEVSALRRRVREAGANFKVTKNTLAKIALEGTTYEPLGGHFQGPTAMCWSEDPVAAAKVLVENTKRSRKIEIQGGMLGNTQLSAEGVKELAEMPSLDELRGRLVGLIQQPASKVVGVLDAPGAQVARVLKARADKEGGEAAA